MRRNNPFCRTLWVCSALALIGAASPFLCNQQAAAQEAPEYDRQVNLVYTINDLGYTDTCG